MSKTFTLYLVRHAQSQNNARPDSQRVSDPPITSLGEIQAAKLSDRLYEQSQDGRAEEIYLCSPFLRTLQTLQPTARRLGTSPYIRSQLFEAGGCYEGYRAGELVAKPGMNKTEIAADFPEYIIPEDIDENGWYRLDGFEPWDDAAARAKLQATITVNEFFDQSDSVLCMVHGDLISLMLKHFFSGEVTLSETSVANSSITSLRFSQRDKPPELLSHNDTAHLLTSEITY